MCVCIATVHKTTAENRHEIDHLHFSLWDFFFFFLKHDKSRTKEIVKLADPDFSFAVILLKPHKKKY